MAELMKRSDNSIPSRMPRRAALKLMLVAAAGTTLAACGATPTPTPTPRPPTPTPTKAPAAPAAPTATPVPAAPTATKAPTAAPTVAKATSSGKIVIAQGIDPRSLWANSSTAQQEINVSEQIQEKLIEFTADGSGFEPRLATEWKQLDDMTLQMKLRQGVKFTNGEEFDSESAALSIDVLTKAPSYAAFASSIAKGEPVDKYTINIKTATPTGLHLLALAMGSFQYPKKLYSEVGSDGFAKKPVGTGPYTFVEWVKDSQVTLEANPNYWGGPPPIKTVVFRNIPEGAARLAALEAGDIDFSIDIPLDGIERLEKNPNVKTYSRLSFRIFSLTMSKISDSPLKNPKVRQALQYAIDVDGLINALFKGRGKRLQGQLLAPEFFGFDPNRKAKPYDVELTKKLLAEAGYPNGFECVFKYSSGRYAQDKEAGQAIASQLAKVGVRTKQEVLESGTFLTQLSALQLNDMYLGGSLPPPDAHFMFQQYQTGFRYSYYTNPQFDELFKKASVTVDPEARKALYKQIMDIFEEDPPYVPLYQIYDYYASNKKLAGFTPRSSQFLDVRAWSLT